MSERFVALGLSSRADRAGIHAAVIETDGDTDIAARAHSFTPFNREMKIHLSRAERAAREGRDGAADIGKADGELTLALISAVENFLEKHGLRRTEIDVIGLGGHVLLQRPPASDAAPGRHWALGDGPTLAQETRIDVVADFAAGDLAARGFGAPLAPVFHRALIASMEDRPACSVGVLTLNEVAQVTYAPEEAGAMDLLAYEPGPGLTLLDEWTRYRPEGDDASIATGKIVDEALAMMGLNPYLRRRPPKHAGSVSLKLDELRRAQPADGAATIAAFIADCIARSESFLPEPPGGYIVCGDGRMREGLMGVLRERLEADIATAEEAGWNGDALDAQCAAFLAVRSLTKKPLTYPGTTRSNAPARGGVFHRAPG